MLSSKNETAIPYFLVSITLLTSVNNFHYKCTRPFFKNWLRQLSSLMNLDSKVTYLDVWATFLLTINIVINVTVFSQFRLNDYEY